MKHPIHEIPPLGPEAVALRLLREQGEGMVFEQTLKESTFKSTVDGKIKPLTPELFEAWYRDVVIQDINGLARQEGGTFTVEEMDASKRRVVFYADGGVLKHIVTDIMTRGGEEALKSL